MENQPKTDSSIQTQQVNESLASTQKKINIVIPIILSLLTSGVVFGFAGYFLGRQSLQSQNYLSTDQILTIPTTNPQIKDLIPLSSETPTPSDPTINWKTYSNSQYGLSFRYPPDWTIKTDVVYNTSPRLVTFDTKIATNSQPMEYQNREFFVTYHSNIKDISAWLAENYQGATIVDNSKINNRDFIVINGGVQAKAREYAIKIGENSYLRFVLEPVDKEDEFDKLFNQILFTLKFTN